jgi:hypothetical protein
VSGAASRQAVRNDRAIGEMVLKDLRESPGSVQPVNTRNKANQR